MRKWLKEIRTSRKLTQNQVADLAEISRSYYTQIEKGDKTPSVDVAQKIAKALNFEWAIFFNENCSFKEQFDIA